MKHGLLRISWALLAAACAPVFSANASSQWHALASDMNELRSALILYYRDNGSYPVTDAAGTWYDKLLAANLVSRTATTIVTPNGHLPVDLVYGTPIIFLAPNDPAFEPPIVRCLGQNGADDGGLLDDWDAGKEPNLGYWYKWNWPALYRRAWLCAAASAVIAALIFWLVRPMVLASGIAALDIGCIASVGLPFGFGGVLLVRTSVTTIPLWVDSVALGGVLFLLIGVLILGLSMVRVVKRRRLMNVGKCPMCKYDLRGELDRGCPECGWGRPWVPQ